MNKLNNKGFLLIETLVVSIFVLSICLIIFRNGMPIIQEYEKREYYDDLESIYMANEFREFLLKDSNTASILRDVEGQGFRILSCNDVSDRNKCMNYLKTMQIKDNENGQFILAKWNMSSIGNYVISNNDVLDKNYRTYIKYLSNQIIDDVPDTYRLIIERETLYNNVINQKFSNMSFPKVN